MGVKTARYDGNVALRAHGSNALVIHDERGRVVAVVPVGSWADGDVVEEALGREEAIDVVNRIALALGSEP